MRINFATVESAPDKSAGAFVAEAGDTADTKSKLEPKALDYLVSSCFCVNFGGCARDRTEDPLIKSQLN